MNLDRQCPDWASLSQYLTDGLVLNADEEGTRSTIEEHLGACAGCRSRIDELLDVRAMGAALEGSELACGPKVPSGYRLIAERGRGGQGTVYEAIQVSTGRRVALKLVVDRRGGRRGRGRVEREFESVRRLEHPNIVRLYDSGSTDGGRWFAMEFLQGEHLDRWFGGESDLATRVGVVARVANAIHHAHLKGVIHRDLKPSNILVDDSGEPHIVDFGLGRPDATETLTNTGEFAGTLLFAAPEQLEGQRDGIDPRADVYALGVLLYMAATGEHPFVQIDGIRKLITAVARGEIVLPTRRAAAIGRDLEAIVLRAMAPAPADRYQSAEALARDLERWARGDPVEARGSGRTYQVMRIVRRHRLVVFGLALLLVVLGAAATAVFFARQRTELLGNERMLLDDLVRAGRLVRESDDLWPVAGDGPRLAQWLREADEILGRKDRYVTMRRTLRMRALAETGDDRRRGDPGSWRQLKHFEGELLSVRKRSGRRAKRRAEWLEERISALRDTVAAHRAWSYAAGADTWQDERLSELIERLLMLEHHRASVAWRLEREHTAARTQQDRSAWRAAITAIRESDLYDGLVLEPHRSLVPLGCNPVTSLWEFWHPRTGVRPQWDQAAMRWRVGPDTGLVFVLLAKKELKRPGLMGGIRKQEVEPAYLAAYPISHAMAARVLPEIETPAAGKGTRPFVASTASAFTDLVLRLDLHLPSPRHLAQAVDKASDTFDSPRERLFSRGMGGAGPVPAFSTLQRSGHGLFGIDVGLEAVHLDMSWGTRSSERDAERVTAFAAITSMGVEVFDEREPVPAHRWVRPALRVRR